MPNQGLIRPPIFTSRPPSPLPLSRHSIQPPGLGAATADARAGSGIISPSVIAMVQGVFPERIQVTVIGLATWLTTQISLYRVVDGLRTVVRGADGVIIPVSEDSFVRVDAEEPFGTPVTYIAVATNVDGDEVESAASAALTVTATKVVLSDAISNQGAEIVILAWPDKARARENTTFTVGGRNVVVMGPRGGYTASIDFFLEDEDTRSTLDNLLSTATLGVMQMRQPGGYEGVDSYIAVTEDREGRFSQDGSDPRRVWSLDTVEVERWPELYETLAFTLADVAAAFPDPQTLTDLSNAYPTLLALSLGNFLP